MARRLPTIDRMENFLGFFLQNCSKVPNDFKKKLLTFFHQKTTLIETNFTFKTQSIFCHVIIAPAVSQRHTPRPPKWWSFARKEFNNTKHDIFFCISQRFLDCRLFSNFEKKLFVAPIILIGFVKTLQH